MFVQLWLLLQPPPDPVTDVRYRLFLGDMSAFGVMHIFTMFSKNRYHFYEMTGETPETVLQLLQILAVDITVSEVQTNVPEEQMLDVYDMTLSFVLLSFNTV